MFNLIDEKTSSMLVAQGASIVSESIERSVFGVFARNYKKYKAEPGKKDNIAIW